MIALLMALAMQDASQNYERAQQIKANAESTLNSCVTNQARKWSTLADSASAIADGTMYVCRDSCDLTVEAIRNMMLTNLMRRGLSTNSFEDSAEMTRQLTLENYRNAAIAVVLNERFKRTSN